MAHGTAQTTIAEFWPDHVMHKTRGAAPRWDTELGVICACEEVLGWPVEEPPEGEEPEPEQLRETLSQTLKREAREQVDAARAKLDAQEPTGRDDYAKPVAGAFGTYGGALSVDVQLPAVAPSTEVYPDGDLQPSTEDVFAPLEEVEPGPMEPDQDTRGAIAREPARKSAVIDALWEHADTKAAVAEAEKNFVGPEWGNAPLAIEDGDGEDVGFTPMPEERVDSQGRSWGPPPSREPDPADAYDYGSAPKAGPIDFGKLVDEVVASETVYEADADLYPPGGDEAQAGPPYAVGDTVTVGGIDFVKHSESPFDADVTEHVVDVTGAEVGPWSEPEDYEPSNEGIVDTAPSGPVEDDAEVGRDLVPYAGTPIMPSDSDTLDPLNRPLPPLDPTLPYTPADVEIKILEIMKQGENGEIFLRQQIARLHQAQHNLDLRYNLAIAKSDARAADQRKAEAWVATERERFEATQAEMLVRALRDNMHNLRAQLSGFQSVARSVGVSLTNSLDGRDFPKRVESHREPPEPAPWEYR